MNSNPSPPFTEFYSAWKAIGVTALVCLLAVCPLLPDFGNGLTYTAFFYTRYGYPFLVAACVILFIIAAAMLPLIFRAVTNRPAIEIGGGVVRIWGLKWREYPLDALAHGTRRQFGNLLVRCADGKRFSIPLWLYRDPEAVLAHLKG